MRKTFLLFVFLLLISGANAQTKKTNFAGALQIGTPGLSISGHYGVAPKVNLRANINTTFGALKFTGSDSYDYKIEPNLFSAGVSADYFVAGGFKVAGGLYYNANKVDVTLTPNPNETYEINGQNYSGSQLGPTTGKLEFSALSPYIGIGYGNPIGSKITFLVDLGVMYQSNPDVTLSAPNNLKLENEDKIKDEAKKYARFYPVLSLGVGYKF